MITTLQASEIIMANLLRLHALYPHGSYLLGKISAEELSNRSFRYLG